MANYIVALIADCGRVPAAVVAIAAIASVSAGVLLTWTIDAIASEIVGGKGVRHG